MHLAVVLTVIVLNAAIGLILFYTGAVVAHLRVRKVATGTAPLLFLGLAAATLL